jgi:hypothetical protein
MYMWAVLPPLSGPKATLPTSIQCKNPRAEQYQYEICNRLSKRVQDGIVGIATGYWLDN